jgi:hypothetical protein
LSENTDVSKAYEESSTKLSRGFIIMITFVLVFFVAALVPYYDLQHQKEVSLSDSIIRNLTELDRLTRDQEEVSKSIQNYFDVPTLAAINDYKKLDEYFRKLELIQSEGIASSNNLSVNQLETIVPTFVKCNQYFHQNITKWMSCNAESVADGVNKKIVIRYHPVRGQVSPLAMKAKENWDTFNLTASRLILDENNEITSKLPREIDPNSWKQTISNSSARMHTWESTVDSTLMFLVYNSSAESLAWTLLKDPSALRLTYSNEDQRAFEHILDTLNQSKNQIEKEIKGLSEKFEEVEFPVVGKVPLGFTNAVIIYPAAVGVGALICSYYLGGTIAKRSQLHRKLGNEFDPEQYPLWVEPLEPGTTGLVRISRIVLFLSIPLIILVVTTYLVYSIPTKQESFFDIPEMSLLKVSCWIGFILIEVGGIIIAIKLYEYRLPDAPKEKRGPYGIGIG